ncbi:MAG: acetyltransferase [Syntrophaceae bacterium]
MEKFESWAIVELFGHQRIAGKISEQQIGGCSFLRVDVPASENSPAYTKLYGNGAIYGITITDEETARAAAKHLGPQPMDEWSVRESYKLLTAAKNDDGVPF